MEDTDDIIKEIEEFLFRGAYKPIGADCSGDKRGACARSKFGAKCHEFHCCQCATDSWRNGFCPKFVSRDDAFNKATMFYNRVKSLVRFHDDSDKDFKFEHTIVGPDGEEVESEETLTRASERGTEDLRWFSPNSLEGVLILITYVVYEERYQKYENRSRYKLPPNLTSQQKRRLKEFCQENELEFPSLANSKRIN